MTQIAEEHKAAGHEVYVTIDDVTNVHLTCVKCPGLGNENQKGPTYRDRFGHPYS